MCVVRFCQQVKPLPAVEKSVCVHATRLLDPWTLLTPPSKGDQMGCTHTHTRVSYLTRSNTRHDPMEQQTRVKSMEIVNGFADRYRLSFHDRVARSMIDNLHLVAARVVCFNWRARWWRSCPPPIRCARWHREPGRVRPERKCRLYVCTTGYARS